MGAARLADARGIVDTLGHSWRATLENNVCDSNKGTHWQASPLQVACGERYAHCAVLLGNESVASVKPRLVFEVFSSWVLECTLLAKRRREPLSDRKAW